MLGSWEALTTSHALRHAALRGDCFFLGVVDLEHGVELSELEELEDALGRVDQDQLAVLARELSEVTNQLADAGRVDVVDLGEVDDHVRTLVFEHVLESRREELRALAQLDEPFHVQNGEVLGVLLLDDQPGPPALETASDASKSEAMNGTGRHHSVHPAEAERARYKHTHAG